MSGSDHIAAEVTMGVVDELARRGGLNAIAHPHGLQQAGAGLVQAAAVVAPGAVAAVSTGTAAVISTTTAVVAALAPIAAIAAVGYGCYKLFQFLDE